jgi:hypothetical protein
MTKENLFKATPVVGIVAGVAVVCGLVGYIIAQWPVIEATLKPAIISGAFTILAAMGGALVVFWQLRKQAENTIRANRHNEMMKLKKEVYIEILSTCKTAMAANRALQQFVVRFRSDLWSHKYTEGKDFRFPVPIARSIKWFELRADAEEKARAIHCQIRLSQTGQFPTMRPLTPSKRFSTMSKMRSIWLRITFPPFSKKCRMRSWASYLTERFHRVSAHLGKRLSSKSTPR